jgi:hypothetical protein
VSDSLASLSADGSAVTVYTAATESFTTVDTSGSSPVSVPGSITTPYAFSFSASTSSPVMDQQANADALVDPANTETNSAVAREIDGTEDPSAAPAALPMSSNGAFEVDTTAAPAASGGPHFANRAGVVSWANTNTNATSSNDDGHSDDCTDFASRALHSGGGLPETLNWPNTANDQYRYHNSAYASHSWGGAFNNSDFFYLHGATFLSNIWQAVPGDLIWVDWDGDKWRGCTSTTDQNCIDHTGVTT